MTSAENKTWSDRTVFRPDSELRSGAIIVHDSFRALIGGDDVELRKHFTGTEWAEGPTYVPDSGDSGGFVVFSDVPNNRMLKYDPETGETTIFREPSHFSNGNSVDSEGRLLTCEHFAPCHQQIRTRRFTPSSCRRIQRAQTQLAKRPLREIRRHHLVHGSAVRHPKWSRGQCPGIGTRRQLRLQVESRQRCHQHRYGSAGSSQRNSVLPRRIGLVRCRQRRPTQPRCI